MDAIAFIWKTLLTKVSIKTLLFVHEFRLLSLWLQEALQEASLVCPVFLQLALRVGKNGSTWPSVLNLAFLCPWA